MTTMIERMARAMYDRHKGAEHSWETIDTFWYKTYMEKARAALEEMKLPTEAMLKAGDIPGWDDSVSIGLSGEVWSSMITAALEEGE